MQTIPPLSIVRFKPQLPSDYDEKNYPFRRNFPYLFLGEISTMPGHCVIVDDKGKVIWGYHTEHFVLEEDDEPIL